MKNSIKKSNYKGKINKRRLETRFLSFIFLLFSVMLSLIMFSGCASESEPQCNHKWGEWEETTAASCTKNGLQQRTCNLCGRIESTGVSRLSSTGQHTPTEWTVTKAATCTEPGKQESTCSVCGEAITEAIEPLGHQLGEWEIGTQASAYSSGEKIQKCTVCGEIINRDTYYLTPEEVAAAEQALQTAIEIGDISASKTILNSIPIATTDVSNLPNSIAVYYQITNPTNYKIDRIGVRVTLLDSDGKPLTSGTDYISGILPQQFTEGLTSVRCSSPISTVNIEPIYVEFENGAYFSIE